MVFVVYSTKYAAWSKKSRSGHSQNAYICLYLPYHWFWFDNNKNRNEISAPVLFKTYPASQVKNKTNSSLSTLRFHMFRAVSFSCFSREQRKGSPSCDRCAAASGQSVHLGERAVHQSRPNCTS